MIILIGFFWRRATWQGALAALMTTPIVSLVVTWFPARPDFWKNPTLVGTLAGLAAHLVVSLLTPRQTRTFAQTAEALRHQREAALRTPEPHANQAQPELAPSAGD